MARRSIGDDLAPCLMVLLILIGHGFTITDIAGWEGLRGSQVQSTIVLEGGIMTNGTFTG